MRGGRRAAGDGMKDNEREKNPADDQSPEEDPQRNPAKRDSPSADTIAENYREYLKAEREEAERLERYRRSTSTGNERTKP
jgi:hypothetical protein